MRLNIGPGQRSADERETALKSLPRPVALVAAIVGALVALTLAMAAYEADREYRAAIAGAERETLCSPVQSIR